MYPLHQNDTGSFQELAHKSDIKFGQLSILTIEPRCSRGGHYHTHKKEWFCCIHGSCYLASVSMQSGERRSATLVEDEREFVKVSPYFLHTVLNPHDVACELLIISSEEYDPDDPDTVKYEAKELICSS